jgi:hypothetical protein
MKSIPLVSFAIAILAVAGCGKESTSPPSAPTAVVPARTAVKMPRSQVATVLPEAVTGNPTSPGLVQLAPIGSPIWKPVDFHIFSAPMGTASDGYAEFLATALALLPPPNHVFNPSFGVGPGAPHAPPYDTELASGVSAQGFAESHTFAPSQFSDGNGVYLVWMNVATTGATGSSPDFASGPIIPNSLFPIHIAGTSYRNGQVWDPFIATFDVPALNAIDPPFNVEGASHFPVFITDDMDFAPPNTNANGAYSYRFRLTDTSGAGWDLSASFTVAGQGGGGGTKRLN